MAVYFARHRENGLIKIGTTRNVRQRLASLPADLLVAAPGDRRIESMLHEEFAELRVEGEWFKPDPVLLAFIERLADSGPYDEATPARPGYTRRNFSFPVGLFQRIRAAAAEDGIHMAEMIADVLRTWLDRRDARRAKGEAA